MLRVSSVGTWEGRPARERVTVDILYSKNEAARSANLAAVQHYRLSCKAITREIKTAYSSRRSFSIGVATTPRRRPLNLFFLISTMPIETNCFSTCLSAVSRNPVEFRRLVNDVSSLDVSIKCASTALPGGEWMPGRWRRCHSDKFLTALSRDKAGATWRVSTSDIVWPVSRSKNRRPFGRFTSSISHLTIFYDDLSSYQKAENQLGLKRLPVAA